MYQHSKGNHAFPLLAAHGALWGSKHFARGLKIGRALSISMIAKTGMKKQRMAALERFAMAFKEINRQVCVETYTCYHMTRLHGEHPDIAEFIPVDLVESLNSCHQATRKGTTLSDVEKRTLFAAFFYWEQDNIVGPGVDAAVSMMDWPVIMFLAMKPAVGFQYFNNTKWLWFSDFANKEERIDKGLQAFELAESAGWNYVEQSLGSYKIMPEQFLMDPARHFEAIKRKSLCF
ncbi:MAG: hypothetical protein ABJH45_05530 [Paracoccaceae bacterium]